MYALRSFDKSEPQGRAKSLNTTPEYITIPRPYNIIYYINACGILAEKIHSAFSPSHRVRICFVRFTRTRVVVAESHHPNRVVNKPFDSVRVHIGRRILRVFQNYTIQVLLTRVYSLQGDFFSHRSNNV